MVFLHLAFPPPSTLAKKAKPPTQSRARLLYDHDGIRNSDNNDSNTGETSRPNGKGRRGGWWRGEGGTESGTRGGRWG
ncbi:MAG: hypothetical protein M1827_002677 [Pycnora praestabilis]|nr:MAG: hypothetical protein M1827_002677 [Pycnora praestabilis]